MGRGADVAAREERAARKLFAASAGCEKHVLEGVSGQNLTRNLTDRLLRRAQPVRGAV